MIRRLRPASPRVRVRAALVGVVVPLLTLVATSPAHAATTDRFAELGTWAPAAPPGQDFSMGLYGNTQLVFDESRRILWAAVGTPSGLAAYDADTLAPRSAMTMLPWVPRSLTLDPLTGRVIAVERTSSQLGTGFGDPGTTPVLEEYELQGSTVRRVWHDDLSTLGPDTAIASIALDRPGGAIYIASEEAAEGAGLTVSRLALADGPPTLQWSVGLPPACAMVPEQGTALNAGPRPPAVMAVPGGGHAVYVICGVPENIVRPPLSSGIGKLALAPDPATAPTVSGFSFFPISGNFYDSHGSVFDARTGRLIVDEANNESGSEAVFDTTTDRFVGLVDGNLNRFDGMGFDERSGRLYAMNFNPLFGLEVADMRTTPPSQTTTYPHYWYNGTVPIPVDAATSRVFVIHVPEFAGDKRAYYHVLRDTQPPLDVDALAPDPDSNTRDIPEVAGMTGATFSASAQGYGAVLRQVGGAQAAANDIENFFHVTGESDPELRAAYIDATTLSPDEATASSIPADRDQNFTGAEQAAGCAGTPQQLQGTTCPWPYAPAGCFSSDTLKTQTTSGPSGAATSSCSAGQHSATTHAEYTGGDLGAVTAGTLSTTSTLLSDGVAGARVEVTSEARDVSLAGGAVRIARVLTTATAQAHGRPGTAATTFGRAVEGVVLNGTSLCDSPCDLDLVSHEIEAAFPGRLRISFPNPDPGFAKGSPGGFQALLRISQADHVDDVLLGAQPANRVEVPGMVVTTMLDTARPSRTVLMLAGVEAEAHYGIYPLDQFTADQAAGLVPNPPAPPLLATPLDTSTGALPASPVASAPPSRAAAAVSPLSALPALLGWHGWQWALAHPGEMLRLALLWLVLLVPVYLSARRWSLLRRHHLEVDLA
jgi:hypothetical protein